MTKARAIIEGKAGGLINKIVGQDIGIELDFSKLFAAEEQAAIAQKEAEQRAEGLP